MTLYDIFVGMNGNRGPLMDPNDFIGGIGQPAGSEWPAMQSLFRRLIPNYDFNYGSGWPALASYMRSLHPDNPNWQGAWNQIPDIGSRNYSPLSVDSGQ